MTKEIEITEFRDAHLGKVADIIVNVTSKEPWNAKWPSEHLVLDYINDLTKYPNFKGFVSIVDQKVVGVLLGHWKRWGNSKEYFIDIICVDSGYQGKGIGTKLLEALSHYLREQKIKYISGLTNLDYDSGMFFKANGFTESDYLTYIIKRI